MITGDAGMDLLNLRYFNGFILKPNASRKQPCKLGQLKPQCFNYRKNEWM